MKEHDNIPTGKVMRSALGGITAAKIGIKHLAHTGKKKLLPKSVHHDDDTHEKEVGKLIFNTLSQLRGTALKLSQMLSMETAIIPENIRKELAKACDKVIPLNRALIRKAFQREFSQGTEKMFTKFDSKAFAAASLGQVHNGMTKEGKSVAIKIQYPGIASSIESDMKLIRTLIPLLRSTSKALPHKNVTDTIFTEIEERLKEEVDYSHEASMTLNFKKELTLPHIEIPHVYQEYSSKRVITTEKLQGVHLTEWLQSNPTQDERDYYAQLLYDFFITSLFDMKKIHADPHEGNFLFNSEKKTLGVIDFGCVKIFDTVFTDKLKGFIMTLIQCQQGSGSIEDRFNAYINLGLFSSDILQNSNRSKIAELLTPFDQWLVEPFMEKTFDCSKRFSPPVMSMNESKEITPLMKGYHRDMVFFNRYYIGIMYMLEKIGGTIKTNKSKWLE